VIKFNKLVSQKQTIKLEALRHKPNESTSRYVSAKKTLNECTLINHYSWSSCPFLFLCFTTEAKNYFRIIIWKV